MSEEIKATTEAQAIAEYLGLKIEREILSFMPAPFDGQDPPDPTFTYKAIPIEKPQCMENGAGECCKIPSQLYDAQIMIVDLQAKLKAALNDVEPKETFREWFNTPVNVEPKEGET